MEYFFLIIYIDDKDRKKKKYIYIYVYITIDNDEIKNCCFIHFFVFLKARTHEQRTMNNIYWEK